MLPLFKMRVTVGPGHNIVAFKVNKVQRCYRGDRSARGAGGADVPAFVLFHELRSDRQFVFHLQQGKRRALNVVLRHPARVPGKHSVLLAGRQVRVRPEPMLIKIGQRRLTVIWTDD